MSRKISPATLGKLLEVIAWITLVVVAIIAASAPIVQPTDPVTNDTLFTASATIMGFAAFGSALSTFGSNKYLIKSIAFALIPIIVVQSVFMISLLGFVGFPTIWWIGITAVSLMLLVFVMVASRIKSGQMDGNIELH